MSILPSLRYTDTVSNSTYVDTPNFAYNVWLDGLLLGIGSLPIPAPKIAIIGGGVSGLCAAYELGRVGYEVSLFEATDRVGGRCYSYSFANSATPSDDIIELGAMRFPPSEF